MRPHTGRNKCFENFQDTWIKVLALSTSFVSHKWVRPLIGRIEYIVCCYTARRPEILAWIGALSFHASQYNQSINSLGVRKDEVSKVRSMSGRKLTCAYSKFRRLLTMLPKYRAPMWFNLIHVRDVDNHLLSLNLIDRCMLGHPIRNKYASATLKRMATCSAAGYVSLTP